MKRKTITSHKLAELLLKQPDLPVAVQVYDYIYSSKADAEIHGSLKIGILKHDTGDHIIIGPNWYVSRIIFGIPPEE